MARVTDLQDLKKIFNQQIDSLVGVGVSAFNRTGPERFFDRYEIISLKDAREDRYIKKHCRIYSLSRQPNLDLSTEKMNAETIFNHPLTIDYLKKKREPVNLLLYKSREIIERLAQKHNWKLLNNPVELAAKFENKTYFRQILEKLQTGLIPGGIFKIKDLDFRELNKKYDQFVIQEPESSGGRGTYFIKSKEDFDQATAKIVKKKVKEILLTKFINGFSPSITGCATRWGIFATRPQLQILDVAESVSPERGSGQFCGHQWGDTELITEEISDQAVSICQKIGRYLFQEGYQGVFGLDLLVDKETKMVYVIECNPRFLGTFPSIVSLQMKANQISISALHVAEFLDLDIDWGPKIQEGQMGLTKGAQLIIYNREKKEAKIRGSLKPGVYQFKEKKMEFIREGYDFLAIKERDEFIITDGVPKAGARIKGWGRICRVLFGDAIIADITRNQLTDSTKDIVQAVYQGLRI